MIQFLFTFPQNRWYDPLFRLYILSLKANKVIEVISTNC